jgi:hypothetical protein
VLFVELKDAAPERGHPVAGSRMTPVPRSIGPAPASIHGVTANADVPVLLVGEP